MLMASKTHWHLGQLDSLRGIAVLNVLLVHAAYFSATKILHPRLFNNVFWAGQRGVQLFFVVSAFTLFLSFENRRAELRPTINFFLRRLFRLTPMFWLTTIVAIFLWPEIVGSWSDISLSMLYLAFLSPRALLHGAAGSWSIANEMVFYCLLPLLTSSITDLRSSLRWTGISFASLFVLTRSLTKLNPSHDEFWSFLSFLAEFPIFLLGITAYFIWKEYLRERTWKDGERKTVSGALVALTAFLYWMMLPVSNRMLTPESLVSVFLLLSVLVHPWKFISNRFTIFMGKISFSVYLLHFYVQHRFVLWITPRLPAHPVFRSDLVLALSVYAVVVVCTVPLATLSWFFIEEPGIRMGRRMIAWLEQKTQRAQDIALVPSARSVTTAGNSPDAQF
jgi:peptidoglycan/LPS O-acetylase OafA/YrhL